MSNVSDTLTDLRQRLARYAVSLRDADARIASLQTERDALQKKLDNAWESYQREIGLVLAERDRALELLRRLRGWDMLDATSDGPFWRGEIDAVLPDLAGSATPSAQEPPHEPS